MVCGLQELYQLGADDLRLSTAAKQMLARLCDNDYLDQNKDCPGVLKNAQVGYSVGMAENAYSSWGDYYLMEALSRQLKMGEVFW